MNAEASNTLGLRLDIDKLWRNSKAPDIPEVLVNDSAPDLRPLCLSSYREGRLLLDVAFAKADWQAAGYSVAEAARLAAYAFIEIPEDTSSYRRQFITACNRATHPGFFMKLMHASEMHGEEFVTKVLLSPNFDPHDVRSIPFTVTFDYFEANQREIAAGVDQPLGGLLLSDAIESEHFLLEEAATTDEEREIDREVQESLGGSPETIQGARDLGLAAAHEGVRRWLDYVSSNQRSDVVSQAGHSPHH